VLQAGWQPAITPGSIIEAGLTVAQVRATPAPTKRRTLSECIANRVPPMNKLSQEQHVGTALHFSRVGIDLLRLSNQGHTRCLAARIKLETHGLQSAIFLLTID
jgi:hypothetical protein